MPVQKLTISFPPELVAQVRDVAEGNVSSWLADAAERKLRRLRAGELLRAYETEHGAISEEELAQVRVDWPV
jgi:hypothetical protein